VWSIFSVALELKARPAHPLGSSSLIQELFHPRQNPTNFSSFPPTPSYRNTSLAVILRKGVQSTRDICGQTRRTLQADATGPHCKTGRIEKINSWFRGVKLLTSIVPLNSGTVTLHHSLL
jgi:hypothetical protein